MYLPHYTASRDTAMRNLNLTYATDYRYTVLITDFLTLRSRVLLEKLTVSQLVKKFPAFYTTRRFITAVTNARHLSLSRASSIQSTPSRPTSWKSILILCSHLCQGLPSGLFPSGFLHKNPVYTSPHPVRATCPTHLILLDFITRIIFGEQCRSLSYSLRNFFHSPLTSSLLGLHSFLTPYSHTPSV